MTQMTFVFVYLKGEFTFPLKKVAVFIIFAICWSNATYVQYG